MPVRITGLNENIRALKAVGVGADDLKEAFAPLSDKGAVQAKSRAPKRTGRMAGRIRASRRQNAAVITVSGTAYHGYVHFGSVHNHPRPFMYEAVAALESSGVIERDVAAGLNAVIAKAGF